MPLFFVLENLAFILKYSQWKHKSNIKIIDSFLRSAKQSKLEKKSKVIILSY